MGGQLLGVALGKTVILDSERKAVPITQTDPAKFVGVYDLEPGNSITVGQSGDGLTAQVTRQTAFPMMYQGVSDGHARFFITAAGAEIEFVPDANGTIHLLILHQNGSETPAKKR